MKWKKSKQYEARAEIAKALAHPSRLMMLDALGERELCVCELTELIGADQSTISKHLAILKRAGLISDRKQGVMTIYRLEIHCLEGFWSCIEAVLQNRLKQEMDRCSS